MLALRDNAFEPELAGVGEDRRAVAFQMLVEAQAKASFGQYASNAVVIASDSFTIDDAGAQQRLLIIQTT